MLSYCRATVRDVCDRCNRLIAVGEPIALDNRRNRLYCQRCESHPQPEAHVAPPTDPQLDRGNAPVR